MIVIVYEEIEKSSLLLNDNEIICDIVLGCENESIDQGRSCIDKNILVDSSKDIIINWEIQCDKC